jgi:hypothetical protein
MATITITFWATDSEIAEWLLMWKSELSIFIVAMTHHPFALKPLEKIDIKPTINNPSVWRIASFTTMPKLDCAFQSDFEIANPDGLVIDLGRLTEDGLRESWLATRTDNPHAIKAWRLIARDLKQRTKSGVVGVNRLTGKSSVHASERYSRGAEQLAEKGIPMLPITGTKGPIIKLGAP